jgi:Tol biopolymer transport system component
MSRYTITSFFLLFLAGLALGVTARAAQPTVNLREARLEPAGSWSVSSPVTLTVRFDGNVAFAQWQWVGADGRPLVWEGAPLPPRDLRPQGEVWVGGAAAPPMPGTYTVRVTARIPGTTRDVTLTPNLRGTATAEERATRGVAYVRDRNIWMRNLDGTRERALTHYGGTGTASMPEWSRDGTRIAFIRDEGQIGSGPDLWTMLPSGAGARRISTHSPGRALAYPMWGADGSLYVTESRPLRLGTVEVGDTWDLMRVDPATGKRTPILSGTLTPHISPDGKRVAYVQQELTSEGAILLGLAVADLDGRNERVLLRPQEAQGVYAPAWSPDGKLIAFAGENITVGARKAPGLSAPLMHGGTWDLWLVSPDGGAPRLLSAVQEELPFTRWHPDGGRVLYMDPNGYFTVPLTGGDPILIAPHDQTGELSIFAPTPRPAAPLPGPSRCFPETGHCLRGIFLQYWERNGGLTQFGYPTGPELLEERRTVQYTQRARLEWHPENRGTQYEVLLGRLGADVADARSAAGEVPFRRVARPSSPNTLYFPETGHTLSAPLRAYWERNGGLPVFGYPLSEPFRERSATDGKEYLVQYFERNRLEYHPENRGTPSEVLLGLLGVQEHRRRYGP